MAHEPRSPTRSRMTGVVYGRATPSTAIGEDRVANLARRFFLPAAAVTALVLGLLLLVTPRTLVGFYIPLSLFAIAIGLLASVTSLRRPTGRAPAARITPIPSGAGSSSTATHPSPPGPAKVGRAFPPMVPGTGSEWRVANDSDRPGIGSGLAWLARRGGWRAHAAGCEPAPGVVRSPGKAGNLVAIPMRHYYPGVRSALPPEEFEDLVDSLRDLPIVDPALRSPYHRASPVLESVPPPSRPSPGGRAFSEEELDRLFPPAGERRPVLLSQAPSKVGRSPLLATPAAEPPRAVVPPPAPTVPSVDPEAADSPARDEPLRPPLERGAPALDPKKASRAGTFPPPMTTIFHPPPDEPSAELVLEAANPVPPHLRGAGPLLRFEPRASDRRSAKSTPARSVCASCSKVVVDLRMSGPCPKCMRPICHDCLREAILSRGRGWCLDCSTASPPIGAN